MGKKPDNSKLSEEIGQRVDRRTALQQLAGAGLCACCAGLAAGCREEAQTDPAVRARALPVRDEPGLKPLQHAGKDFLRPELVTFSDLPLNKPIEAVAGKTPVFVVRGLDEFGREYGKVFDGRCPHARCKLSFRDSKADPNQSQFVCPCHGSRFTPKGELLRGPAKRNLREVFFQRNEAGVILADVSKEVGRPAAKPVTDTAPPA